MSWLFAIATKASILSIPFSRSNSRPKAVGLIERLASKLFSLMAVITRLYSSRKNDASSIEVISSPRTSIVKQAPSLDNLCITLTASSSSGPATYRRLIQPTNQRGIRMVIPTIIRENSPTMLPC